MQKSKKIKIMLLFSIFCIALTGCSKCIKAEEKEVQVMVQKTTHRPAYYHPQTKMRMPERCQVIIKYNGNLYYFNDKENYQKYKNMEGETINAVLQIKTFDNGKIKENIVELR